MKKLTNMCVAREVDGSRGLRHKTRDNGECAGPDFEMLGVIHSLNVSNAAAITLYPRESTWRV